MSATPQSVPAPVRASRHPLVTVLSLLLVVLGLVIGGLGAWLLSLGGSAYYAIAGAGLLASGLLLFGNRRSGALLYALVFVGTLLWTWWESGNDYWRWVPRLGLVTALGIVLALLAPTLREPVSKRLSRSVAGVLMLVFVAAFGLAFAPHGEVDGHQPFPEGAASAGLEPTRDTTGLQPADQPAEETGRRGGAAMQAPAIRHCSRSPRPTWPRCSPPGSSAPAICRRSAGVRKPRR